MDEFTPEFIAGQIAIAARATPRPWSGDRYDGTVKYGIKGGSDNKYVVLFDDEAEPHQFTCDKGYEDDEYILAAANNYPDALDEIERLREALEKIRGVAGNRANPEADKAVIIGIVNDTLKSKQEA